MNCFDIFPHVSRKQARLCFSVGNLVLDIEVGVRVELPYEEGGKEELQWVPHSSQFLHYSDRCDNSYIDFTFSHSLKTGCFSWAGASVFQLWKCRLLKNVGFFSLSISVWDGGRHLALLPLLHICFSVKWDSDLPQNGGLSIPSCRATKAQVAMQKEVGTAAERTEWAQ